MNLHLLIARRYFFSRKQKTVINIISWISLIGIAVSTTALIVVLSVYNGIGNLTQSLFNSFDPPILVQPAQGKTFHTSQMPYDQLAQVPGVAAVSQIVEENAWITYHHNQAIVSLRGVDEAYPQVTGLDTLLYQGQYILNGGQLSGIPDTANSAVNFLIFGAEIYYNLGIRETSNTPVSVHIPKRGVAMGVTMDQALNTGYAYPAGNFYIQQDIDTRYVVASHTFVRQLLNYAPDECTSLALALEPSANIKRVKQQVRQLLGSDYRVLDRFEQQPIYYKVYRSERLGIYLILALIVLIATLNLVASLSLLVLDKRRDISTLRSLGMLRTDICRIFRIEGLLISAFGVIVGLLVGFVVCFVQQQFGLVKMGDGFIVSAFPVAMRLTDFLLTFLLVMAISGTSVLVSITRRKF